MIKRLTAALLFVSMAFITAAAYSGGGSKAAQTAAYIKYVDFGPTCEALTDALALDVKYHGESFAPGFSASLAYLGAKWGGDFSRYKKSALEELYKKLGNGETLEALTSGMKYYEYYKKAYGAVLDGMVGCYYLNGEEKYGLKAYSPFAKGYYYNDYDDFGASRSFGYKREHLGHDMMGSIGTPIVAVEAGYVEACGWNIYGGWRIGIRSFDGRRYYYYAHLRKNHPYNDIYEGKIVSAGEVIGYLGMTGYSSRENVNNISTPHLHIGLQLIFDVSQKDGYNQIWVDMYALTKFLLANRAEVVYDESTKEYNSVNLISDPSIDD